MAENTEPDEWKYKRLCSSADGAI